MAGAVAANLPRTLVGVFYDDGIYVALAKSLAEGQGYRLLYLPNGPSAVHYPFGYPLFLAALWRVWPSFPANVALFKAANAALMGLFAFTLSASLGTSVIGRRWLAALVVGAGATAIPLVATASVLFAEPLFLVLAALACWAAESARGREGRRLYGLAAAAGLLAGAAALTRSIGVAVIGGVALALWRKPRAAITAGAIGLASLVPWELFVAAHHVETEPVLAANYGTYGDLMAQSGWGWLSLGSLADLGRPLAALVLPPLPPALWKAAAVWTMLVLAFGVVVLIRRAPAAGWTLAAYLALVAVWPYGPDRFLWAAVPWLALAFAAALGVMHRSAGAPAGGGGAGGVAERPAAAAGRRSGRDLLRPLALLTGVLVVSGFTVNGVRGYLGGSATAAQRGISETFTAVLPWIRQATHQDDVIAGEDEALLWLYTGRRAVPSSLWHARGRSAEYEGPDALKAYFDRMGVTHVILTGPGSEAAQTLDAMLARYPGYLNPEQVWPGSMMAFRVARR